MLQAVHQQLPFIAIWDDHEVANDATFAGAQNHEAETEGPYAERLANARQAYMEWMPIREQDPTKRIYRRFQFGDLVDLFSPDSSAARQGREQNPHRRRYARAYSTAPHSRRCRCHQAKQPPYFHARRCHGM